MSADPVRRATLACLSAAFLPAALSTLAGCESVPLSDIGPSLDDDEPLSRAVRAALAEAPETLNRRIRVKTVSEGVVRLSGNVDTDITRTFAAQIAERVAGVQRVVNTLYVRE